MFVAREERRIAAFAAAARAGPGAACRLTWPWHLRQHMSCIAPQSRNAVPICDRRPTRAEPLARKRAGKRLELAAMLHSPPGKIRSRRASEDARRGGVRLYCTPFPLKNAVYFLSVPMMWFCSQVFRKSITGSVSMLLPASKSRFNATAFSVSSSCSCRWAAASG